MWLGTCLSYLARFPSWGGRIATLVLTNTSLHIPFGTHEESSFWGFDLTASADGESRNSQASRQPVATAYAHMQGENGR